MWIIKKIEKAIKEVRKNPKYKNNRILLLDYLEKRLVNEIAKRDIISLNKNNLIRWQQ